MYDTSEALTAEASWLKNGRVNRETSMGYDASVRLTVHLDADYPLIE